MLFEEFYETFFEVCNARKNSDGELAQKRMCLENHLLPFFGEFEFETIGSPELREYVQAKLEDGYAEKTINNHLLVLSRYLAVAHDERAYASPRVKIHGIPAQWTEARFLTPPECQRLLQATEIETPEWRGMVVVALNTGMRIGEILALDWREIDLDARKISVTKSLCRVSGKLKPPKNRKRREVFLNEPSADALLALPHRSGRVFACSYQGAYSALARISERAGIEGIGWHTLRHTFASFLVIQGVTLFAVSRLLGHSSTRITERYAHLGAEKNLEAVQALATAMGSKS